MNWQLFLSIYVLIFVAELPDKTAFATLLLAARGRMSAVFFGVAAAFLVQTLVATLFGSAIALLPAAWVHLGAAILFLGFAFQMWRDRAESDDDDEKTNFLATEFWPCAWRSFVVIFIAEWGDLTQIATASLIAKYHDAKLTVFFAALLALWSVTLVAVFLGHEAKIYLNPKYLRTVGAIAFLGIGLYFLISALLTFKRLSL